MSILNKDRNIYQSIISYFANSPVYGGSIWIQKADVYLKHWFGTFHFSVKVHRVMPQKKKQLGSFVLKQATPVCEGPSTRHLFLQLLQFLLTSFDLKSLEYRAAENFSLKYVVHQKKSFDCRSDGIIDILSLNDNSIVNSLRVKLVRQNHGFKERLKL